MITKLSQSDCGLLEPIWPTGIQRLFVASSSTTHTVEELCAGSVPHERKAVRPGLAGLYGLHGNTSRGDHFRGASAKSNVSRLGKVVDRFALHQAVTSTSHPNRSAHSEGAARVSCTHLSDVNNTSRKADSDLGPDHSEFAQRAASKDSPPLRSMLDFDESRTGVHVRQNRLLLPSGMSFDSWRELGSRVALIANCSAWWLGDWLVYGEQAYGDRYKQAIADTSLSYGTLRNYAWMARKFSVSRRRDTLSFGHHAEVAGLTDDEQDLWLSRAERLDWSRNRLRRELRTANLAKPRASGDEASARTRALKFDVPTERHDRWQFAAEQQNCSVADWIIETLDRAAYQELSTGTTRRDSPSGDA
jgi:hypothetical protein